MYNLIKVKKISLCEFMLYTATKVNIQHFTLICKGKVNKIAKPVAYYAKKMYNYSKLEWLPEKPHCGRM